MLLSHLARKHTTAPSSLLLLMLNLLLCKKDVYKELWYHELLYREKQFLNLPRRLHLGSDLGDFSGLLR